MNKFILDDIVNIVGIKQYENETMKIVSFRHIEILDVYLYNGMTIDGKYYILDILEKNLEMSKWGNEGQYD